MNYSKYTFLLYSFSYVISTNNKYVLFCISLGNAKTVRNNNSSRFGKFVQIHMNAKYSIVGASIVNYLLEKTRVAQQSKTERNYHVFYQMTAGANADEKNKYKINAANTYNYLTQSGCIDMPGVSDSKNFEALKLAFQILNMGPEDVDAILRTLSAILHLGNVKFNESADKESVKIANPDVTAVVASLLGVSDPKLIEALTFKRLVVRSDVTMVPYKAGQAIDSRDSIAKAIYDALFQKVVDGINASLVCRENPVNFVGVLDIFGFEGKQLLLSPPFSLLFASMRMS